MKIEKGDAHKSYVYWTVQVNANELVVASGKKLPYGTWIGTIRKSKTGNKFVINVWTPAASVPRGYKAAAKELLEQAVGRIATGLVK